MVIFHIVQIIQVVTSTRLACTVPATVMDDPLAKECNMLFPTYLIDELLMKEAQTTRFPIGDDTVFDGDEALCETSQAHRELMQTVERIEQASLSY